MIKREKYLTSETTMKNIMVLLFGLLVIVSCQKESNLNKELSDSDKLVIEYMEEDYKIAKLYNDSLIWCNDTSNNCASSFTEYCDSIFHVFDDLYEMHHNNYSHNNMEDDHHHSSMSEHHLENQVREEGNEEHQGHTLESYIMMTILRENHKPYHP
jgi:hypothetical protein